MKTVVLTPYRRTPERERIWRFVQAWIRTNYDMPIFAADSDTTRFSPAQARNNAARMAGDWDVAVFHDCDTIVHPEALAAAIQTAGRTDQMVIAADSHMYCNPASSQRIMFTGVPMFARPDSFDNHGIYEKPCSGVFAVNRNLWAKTGGYIGSLQGWGYEDLCFLQQCGIFADGHTWVPNHISLHMWHPPTERSGDTQTNKQVWQRLTQYRRRRDIDGAKTYLAALGHRL